MNFLPGVLHLNWFLLKGIWYIINSTLIAKQWKVSIRAIDSHTDSYQLFALLICVRGILDLITKAIITCICRVSFSSKTCRFFFLAFIDSIYKSNDKQNPMPWSIAINMYLFVYKFYGKSYLCHHLILNSISLNFQILYKNLKKSTKLPFNWKKLFRTIYCFSIIFYLILIISAILSAKKKHGNLVWYMYYWINHPRER